MQNGHIFALNATGSGVFYPGHPLVLATIIMEAYPDFASANKPTGLGWCEALGDNRIPGAGCHVNAAMRVLQLGADGAAADAMVTAAADYWVSGGAGGHLKNVDRGVSQAAVMEPLFRARAASWFRPQVPGPSKVDLLGALRLLRSRGFKRVRAALVAETLWPAGRSQNANGQFFHLSAGVAGRMLRKCPAVREVANREWEILSHRL